MANLPVHVRSNTDLMSLVLLYGEDDLKHFECAKVFADMLLELKDFEENSVTVGGERVQGAFYCIAGDNLGSHSIGGFKNWQDSDTDEILPEKWAAIQDTYGCIN